MRFFAFLAGLAGLTAIVAQGLRIAGANGLEAVVEYADEIILVSQWSQMAFILLVAVFMFVFALSKASKAEADG